MQCGYGYNKGSDGSCTSTESWVCIPHLEVLSASNLRGFYAVVYHGLLSELYDIVVSTSLQWAVDQTLIRTFCSCYQEAPMTVTKTMMETQTVTMTDFKTMTETMTSVRFFFQGMRS